MRLRWLGADARLDGGLRFNDSLDTGPSRLSLQGSVSAEALRQLPNVVLTPHMASGTAQTRKAMSDLALANLQAHLAGQALLTPVPECRAR